MIIECRMTTFKVVSVHIFTDCLPCFSDIVILGQICFLVLEASEPSFNHDIVSPPAFTIHALTDLVLFEKVHVLIACEFSEEDEMFFGRVLGIRSLISYEGDNAKDLIADFHNSVDEYLKWCEDEGRKPEKAYKGSFNIRISPKLHKQLVICAMSHDMTLNGYIQEILEKAVVL